MRIIVIGMNPSRILSIKNKETFTFKKLKHWMNNLGVKYFSFSNVNENIDHISLSKVDFSRLNTITSDYDRVIALGNFASDALHKIRVNHFKLPHPSPRNRLLNDKDYENKILQQCKEYLI